MTEQISQFTAWFYNNRDSLFLEIVDEFMARYPEIPTEQRYQLEKYLQLQLFTERTETMTELTHQQLVSLIEDVQYLRDLATLEIARREQETHDNARTQQPDAWRHQDNGRQGCILSD